MKPKADLSQLKVGDSLRDAEFVLVNKLPKTTGKGDVFNVLTLRNASGDIQGKVWPRNMKAMEGIQNGDAVLIGASVGEYNGVLELDVVSVIRLPDNHPVRDCMNLRCPTPLPALEARFEALVSLIRHPGYRAFVDAFFRYGVSKEDYFHAPAAIGHHHNYIHGLLEHTVEVCENALEMSDKPRFRDYVDRDYLIVGALFHDVAKVVEYQWRGTPISMSWVGRFKDHITMGPELCRIVWEHGKEGLLKAGFTEAHLILVQHVQVTHHRLKEWGSPKEPATAEALVVHLADKFSADMRAVGDIIESSQVGEDGWIDRGKNSLFVPKVFFGPKAAPAKPSATAGGGDDLLTLL